MNVKLVLYLHIYNKITQYHVTFLHTKLKKEKEKSVKAL